MLIDIVDLIEESSNSNLSKGMSDKILVGNGSLSVRTSNLGSHIVALWTMVLKNHKLRF